MPILDYTGASSGLFVHLGKLIARMNGYTTLGRTTLPADVLTLLASFGVTWLPEEGVAAYYDGLRDDVTGWRTGLGGWADRRLADRDTVLVPLGLDPSAGVSDVLPALRRAMLADGKSVKACNCAVGTVTPDAANVGNGTAYLTLTLDGVSPPVQGGQAYWWLDGVRSQMCVPAETMVLECVADSVLDGVEEGAEQWTWTGGPDFGELDVRAEGSGAGPSVQTADAGGNLLSNGGFESGTTTPTGWAQEGPVVAVLTGVNPRRGVRCARFAGSGQLKLTQLLATAGQARRRYFCGLSVRSDAGAVDPLNVYFTGASGTPAGLTIAPPGTGWASYGFFVTFPAPVPSDWRLALEVVGTGGAALYVDDVSVSPVDYHGAVGVAVQAGATAWRRGDRLTWSVANDQAGKFQDFFRRWYRFQLPSVAGAGVAGWPLSLGLSLMSWAAAEGIPDGLVV